ncbi:MAG: SDR family NAD(P)-dependent oxidoreductase [Planctomycetia bacterium]|nr:SDR family NAD(P)-dependent oxidoreductase [Planctomycetia bacterium]
MDLFLKDKTVLVTGAAKGLGAAIATLLAQEGARVVINYSSSREAAASLSHQLTDQYGVRTLALQADVSNEAEVISMFDAVEAEFGPVDALVNNAAYCANPCCVDLDLAEFQKTLAVNLQGTFLASREFCRRALRDKRTGNIVNISSQAALRGSQSGKTAYDMTKAGIVGFTRSLSLEMAPHCILVNCVLPGLMYTDILARQIAADPDRYNKRSPLGRIGRCEEIAQVAVFLCSSRASYMSGASVDVSGGLALH